MGKRLVLESITIRVDVDADIDVEDSLADLISEQLEMGCNAVAENIKEKFKHLKIEVEVE